MKKLSMKKLRMLIEQEIDHDLAAEHPSEIEPIEAFSGGDNLVHPVDYADVTSDFGDEDRPKAPEMLSLIDGEGVITITVSESKLRSIVRNLLTNSK